MFTTFYHIYLFHKPAPIPTELNHLPLPILCIGKSHKAQAREYASQ